MSIAPSPIYSKKSIVKDDVSNFAKLDTHLPFARIEVSAYTGLVGRFREDEGKIQRLVSTNDILIDDPWGFRREMFASIPAVSGHR